MSSDAEQQDAEAEREGGQRGGYPHPPGPLRALDRHPEHGDDSLRVEEGGSGAHCTAAVRWVSILPRLRKADRCGQRDPADCAPRRPRPAGLVPPPRDAIGVNLASVRNRIGRSAGRREGRRRPRIRRLRLRRFRFLGFPLDWLVILVLVRVEPTVGQRKI